VNWLVDDTYIDLHRPLLALARLLLRCAIYAPIIATRTNSNASEMTSFTSPATPAVSQTDPLRNLVRRGTQIYNELYDIILCEEHTHLIPYSGHRHRQCTIQAKRDMALHAQALCGPRPRTSARGPHTPITCPISREEDPPSLTQYNARL
jgi:hypothetical protein